MGEAQGERTVVAEQQGAAAGRIEAAHGMQPLAPRQLRGQQVEHGGAALGVVAAAHHAGGFVQQQH